MIKQGKGFDLLTNSLKQFVKEDIEISQENLHVNTSIPMQAAITAYTEWPNSCVKSRVIFYILYSRVSEVVSNFKYAVQEMLPALFIPANINWKASLYPYAAISWRQAETL